MWRGEKRKNKRNTLKTHLTWLWSVAMKQRIFPLSGFTYHKIYDQDKRSHETICHISPGFPLHVYIKVVVLAVSDQSQRSRDSCSTENDLWVLLTGQHSIMVVSTVACIRLHHLAGCMFFPRFFPQFKDMQLVGLS